MKVKMVLDTLKMLSEQSYTLASQAYRDNDTYNKIRYDYQMMAFDTAIALIQNDGFLQEMNDFLKKSEK